MNGVVMVLGRQTDFECDRSEFGVTPRAIVNLADMCDGADVRIPEIREGDYYFEAQNGHYYFHKEGEDCSVLNSAMYDIDCFLLKDDKACSKLQDPPSFDCSQFIDVFGYRMKLYIEKPGIDLIVQMGDVDPSKEEMVRLTEKLSVIETMCEPSRLEKAVYYLKKLFMLFK